MLQIFESFLPLAAFFILFHLFDIYIATAGLMAVYAVILLIRLFLKKPIKQSDWVMMLSIAVFGSATLYFHDDLYIKWKPTVVFWLFSIGITANLWFSKIYATQWIFQDKITMAASHYRLLDQIMAIYFFLLGGLNIYVFSNYDSQTWVHFKVFGILFLTLVLTVFIGIYISKYAHEITTSQNTD